MSFPILSFLTFFPLVGVIFILLRKGSIEVVERSAKNIAVLVSLVNFFVSCYLWSKFNPTTPGFQFVEGQSGLQILQHIKWVLMVFLFF